MLFSILLSPDAMKDIDNVFEYYNSKSDGLGLEFTDIINFYLLKSVMYQLHWLSDMTMSG